MVSQVEAINESLVVAIVNPLLALVIPVVAIIRSVVAVMIQVVCWCELSDGHCRSMVAFLNQWLLL